jgi:hypothetical protein
LSESSQREQFIRAQREKVGLARAPMSIWFQRAGQGDFDAVGIEKIWTNSCLSHASVPCKREPQLNDVSWHEERPKDLKTRERHVIFLLGLTMVIPRLREPDKAALVRLRERSRILLIFASEMRRVRLPIDLNPRVPIK